MSTQLQFSEEVAWRLEAMYMTPDVIARRREILHALAVCPGERVLDIGTGPGFLTTEMAAAVGPSGRVCGIDSSATMLSLAQTRCAPQSWVVFREGNATQLPFPNGVFDAAVAAQVYEYVHDLPTALAELFRVLRPGGRAVVYDTDWHSLVWHATDRRRTANVLAAFDEHLADPCLPRTLASKLKAAGFVLRHQKLIPIFNPKYDANTASYWLMGMIVEFVPGRQGVMREDAEAWADDLRKLGEEDAYFFSMNQYLFLAVKPDTQTIAQHARVADCL